MVNIWANLIADILKKKNPGLKFEKNKFKFISTIDVDNAWAYLNKGVMRGSAALMNSMIKGKWEDATKRINTWFGNEKDPYDTYEFLDSVFKGNSDKVRFFFLMGDYAKYDKNNNHRNRAFRKLIANTSEKYISGLTKELDGNNVTFKPLDKSYRIPPDSKYIKSVAGEIKYGGMSLGKYEIFYTERILHNLVHESNVRTAISFIVIVLSITAITFMGIRKSTIQPILHLARISQQVASSNDYSTRVTRRMT